MIFVVIWGIYLLLGTTTMAVSWHMALLPLLILAALAVVLGIFPKPLTDWIAALVNTVV